MTRSNWLFLLLPVALWGCSGHKTITETDPDLGYITTYEVDPKSGLHDGLYTRTDSTGLLIEKGTMRNGKLSGYRELYYLDGKVKVRERYKDGQFDDLYEYFRPDGSVELKGYYIGGAMYGQWRKFTPAGQLMESVTMINNEEMGPFTEYHPNGKIKTEGTYLHGPNEDGRLKLYDESGQLQKEMLCYNGRCYTLWPKE